MVYRVLKRIRGKMFNSMTKQRITHKKNRSRRNNTKKSKAKEVG
jgi:hypothetical protein